ncbi:MAG: Rieske 2Fe-2S domain-containing protein [Planctomycetaceae bacterium]|jgi:Rieske Fe-S protein|nr:Rieske 2Fe-2S domain-containing protein [Planctomycetaceae bacterium]
MSSCGKKNCGCSNLGTGAVRRRGFLGFLFGLAGGIIASATPICAAIKSVIVPLKDTGLGGKFYPLVSLESLDETPQKFPIADDVKDAWITLPHQTIGNVYVRKIKEGGETKVLAWQSLCPHAGCTIGLKTQKNPDTQNVELLFACPCHVAHFDLNGQLLDKKPDAPRNMDSLETKIENGQVFVKFEVFTFGTREKKASS